MVGRQPVEGRHLGQEGGHVAVAELEVVLAESRGRASQHVVVDIGQVLDVDHVVAEVLQVPMQDVEAQVGERMAQVAGVVRRHAADVEADAVRRRWVRRARSRRGGRRTGAGSRCGILGGCSSAVRGWTGRVESPRRVGTVSCRPKPRRGRVGSPAVDAVFVIAHAADRGRALLAPGQAAADPAASEPTHHSSGLVLIRKPMTPMAAAIRRPRSAGGAPAARHASGSPAPNPHQAAQVRPRDEGGDHEVDGVERPARRAATAWPAAPMPRTDQQADTGQRQPERDHDGAGALHGQQAARWCRSSVAPAASAGAAGTAARRLGASSDTASSM